MRIRNITKPVDESGIMYKAGVKKYGKDGMKKIQSAAGKGASHEEIGKIKDKHDKTREDVDIDKDFQSEVLRLLMTKTAAIERQIQDQPAVTQEDKENKEFALKLFDFVQAKLAEKDSENKENIAEVATPGATSAGNIATVANPNAAYGHRARDKNGVPKAPQKRNPNGTAKNALDVSDNLMGGTTIKR